MQTFLVWYICIFEFYMGSYFQHKQSPYFLHKLIYKFPPLLAPPVESAESPGWYSSTQSLHRGVAQVLHPVRHFAQALLSVRDHSDGQAGQQQEVQRGGQHCSKGEWAVLPESFVAHLASVTALRVFYSSGWNCTNPVMWCSSIRSSCQK